MAGNRFLLLQDGSNFLLQSDGKLILSSVPIQYVYKYVDKLTSFVTKYVDKVTTYSNKY